MVSHLKLSLAATFLLASCGVPRADQLNEGEDTQQRTQRLSSVGGSTGVQLTGGSFRLEGPAFALAFTTQTISVAGQDQPFEPARAHLGDLGYAHINRGGGVVETLHAGEASLEQSWHFDESPGDHGDLVVRVDVAGSSLPTEEAHGLVFREGHTQLHYSHGTWVDARGNETHVPSVFVNGAIELRVPAPVVAGSAFPAVLDPTITVEHEVGPPALQALQGVIRGPAAWNGTEYLVAFRVGTNGWATRVAADGTASSAFELPTTMVRDVSCLPTMCVGDANVGGNVSLMLVPSAGAPTTVVLDSSISTQANTASNGTAFLAAWPVSSTEFRMRPVDVAGVPGVAQTHDLGMRLSRLAGSPSGYIGTLMDPVTGRYHFQRFDAGGALVGVPTRIDPDDALPADDAGAVVAWDGEAFAVVVVRDFIAAAPSVTSYRVSPAGAVSFGSTLDVPAMSRQFLVALACDGTGTCIAHSRSSALVVRLGAFVGVPATTTITGLVAGADGFLDIDVTATIDRILTAALLSSDAGGSLIRGVEEMVSLEPAARRLPVAAGSGVDFLLAYSDERVDFEARATRIAADGTILDPEGIDLGDFQPEDAVFDGVDRYAIVGSRAGSFTGVGGRILRTDGTTVETTFTIGSRTRQPAVGFDGTNFLVVVRDNDGILQAYRVNRVGAVLDAVPLALSTRAANLPAVSFDGTNYLVVWIETVPDRAAEIWGARVTPSLTLLDDPRIPIASGSGNQSRPDVSAGPEGWLVAWSDSRDPVGVRGTPVSTDGVVGSLEGVSYLTGRVSSLNLVNDGVSYLLTIIRPSPGVSDLQVVSGRVAYDGTNLDGDGFLVADSVETRAEAVVASTESGRSLVAYGRERSFRLDDVYFRILGNDALAAPCAGASECESGFCVDGVCCDSACGGGASDCQVCAVVEGAVRDGICAPAPSDVVCRASSGTVCDVEEACDGVTLACPDDIADPTCMLDGGVPDGGVADGGVADGGVADGGVADGGVADGGVADGGVADGGVADGGVADGGVADGGGPDADLGDGSTSDSGAPDGGSTGTGGGCSVASGGGGAGSAFVWLTVSFGLFVRSRRRRA